MGRPLVPHRSSFVVRLPGPKRGWLAIVVILAVVMGAKAKARAGDDAKARVEVKPAGQKTADDSPRSRPADGYRPRAARISGFTWLRGESSESGWSWPTGLALVAAAGGLVAVAARRRGNRSTEFAVEIVGRAALSPRHSVHLLRVGRRVLLVGSGPQGPPALIAELEDLPRPEQPTTPEGAS